MNEIMATNMAMVEFKMKVMAIRTANIVNESSRPTENRASKNVCRLAMSLARSYEDQKRDRASSMPYWEKMPTVARASLSMASFYRVSDA